MYKLIATDRLDSVLAIVSGTFDRFEEAMAEAETLAPIIAKDSAAVELKVWNNLHGMQVAGIALR